MPDKSDENGLLALKILVAAVGGGVASGDSTCRCSSRGNIRIILVLRLDITGACFSVDQA